MEMQSVHEFEGAGFGDRVSSHLLGEMSLQATEGDTAAPIGWPSHANINAQSSRLQPSALPGISPSSGEIGQSLAFAVHSEAAVDFGAREALLDRAMGAGRKRKSSEKLRRGRRPSEGLAFVARAADG